MLGDAHHHPIDIAENQDDNQFCGHASRSTMASTPIVSALDMTISTYSTSTSGFIASLLSAHAGLRYKALRRIELTPFLEILDCQTMYVLLAIHHPAFLS
jgi:hypothetical protein